MENPRGVVVVVDDVSIPPLFPLGYGSGSVVVVVVRGSVGTSRDSCGGGGYVTLFVVREQGIHKCTQLIRQVG